MLTHRLQPDQYRDRSAGGGPFNSCLRTGCNADPRIRACADRFLQLVLTHRLQRIIETTKGNTQEPSTRAYAQVATDAVVESRADNAPSTRAYAQVATSTEAFSAVSVQPSTRAYAQVATLSMMSFRTPRDLQLVLTHRLQQFAR